MSFSSRRASSRRPRPHRAVWVGGALALLSSITGCQQAVDPPDIPSLKRSGEVSFLCIDDDGIGAPLDRCPKGRGTNDGGLLVAREGYELHALVTQTVSSEVAVVRVTGANQNGASNSRVLDVDPSNPGVTPLRVGGKPGDIVSTPGGHASFVGVSEVGREGIFALPTSCIFAPKEKEDGTLESRRDLTTWPACSLSSAPGDMVILVDPADSDGLVRSSCGGAFVDPASLEPAGATRDECAVDLRQETANPGRRKLVVALPEEGKLVVLDAQALLDREQGSFAPCEIEAELPLDVNLPARISQPLPPDLVVPGCSEPTKEYGPFPGPFSPRPAGMDERGGVLAIADQGAPVVHLVDARDPCELVELAPLVATSFDEPERVVTTSRVTLSPVTPDGNQYLYAIDEVGEQVASIMAFDLTPGAPGSTPLVRPGAAATPLEPVDRIEFAAAVKDVAFVLLDEPEVDPVTGVSALGLRCDPNPGGPDRYRPVDDEGAGPSTLRGLFAYVLLSSGEMVIVDVDDFDAACRRPIQSNPNAVADFRGCSSDPSFPPFYTLDATESGTPTVTGEVSCQVVEPHRARSSNRMIVDDTATAPSLSAFGRLSLAGRGLAVSRATPEGRKKPILLGVDFEGPRAGELVPAQVYVGTTLRTRGDATNELVTNPNLAEQASLVLPWIEPRAYPSEEVATVTYEGDLDDLHRTGLWLGEGDGEDLRAANVASLADRQAFFCQAGVQSVELTAEVARQKFGLSGGAEQRFAERHADYLQVTNLLLDEEDPYWRGAGASCGGDEGYAICDSVFGDGAEASLAVTRDFRILRAYQNRLLVEPRAAGDAAEKQRLYELLDCCFPDLIEYRLRAGHQWVVRGDKTGFQHSVAATPVTLPDGTTDYLCVRDCSPLKAGYDGRAFELSSTRCANSNPDDPDACGVGLRTPDDVVCVYDAPSLGDVTPGESGSECIFSTPTRRFAIYRGLEPSERGLTFGFDVVGGFSPYRIALTTRSTTIVLPVSLTPVLTFGQLGVVDSQNRGLMMVDTRSARVSASFF